jgi:hypothetical protein
MPIMFVHTELILCEKQERHSSFPVNDPQQCEIF